MYTKKSLITLLLISVPNISYAYLGMGPILPMLGSALVFIFLIVIGIFGIFFYPIKKLLEKRKKNNINDNDKENTK